MGWMSLEARTSSFNASRPRDISTNAERSTNVASFLLHVYHIRITTTKNNTRARTHTLPQCSCSCSCLLTPSPPSDEYRIRIPKFELPSHHQAQALAAVVGPPRGDDLGGRSRTQCISRTCHHYRHVCEQLERRRLSLLKCANRRCCCATVGHSRVLVAAHGAALQQCRMIHILRSEQFRIEPAFLP